MVSRITWLLVQVSSHCHTLANDTHLGISQCVYTHAHGNAHTVLRTEPRALHMTGQNSTTEPPHLCVWYEVCMVSSLSNLPDEPRACQISPQIPSPAPEYWDYRRVAMPVQHLCGCWRSKICLHPCMTSTLPLSHLIPTSLFILRTHGTYQELKVLMLK